MMTNNVNNNNPNNNPNINGGFGTLPHGVDLLTASFGQAIDVVDSWLEGTPQGRQRAKEIWRVIRRDPNRTLNQRMIELQQAYNRRTGFPNDPNIKAWALLGDTFAYFVHHLTH
jgi:hypothetical protein